MSNKSKFFKDSLSLGHFIRRQNVLSIYRDYMRTTAKIDNDAHRKDTRSWVRSEFDQGKRVQDPELVQMHITRAKDGLRDLKTFLEHAHVKR